MSVLILKPESLVINADIMVLGYKLFESEFLSKDSLAPLREQKDNLTEVNQLTVAFIRVFALPDLLKEVVNLVAVEYLLEVVVGDYLQNGPIFEVRVQKHPFDLLIFQIVHNLAA